MSKELDIIAHIAATSHNAKIFQDDAYWDPTRRLIFTTDMLVENRHFSLDYFSPSQLGWKAAAVNLSDIAASGGIPLFLLISIGLPTQLDLSFVEQLYEGFNAICQEYGAHIIGGDTVSSPEVIINITAIGHCPTGTNPGHRFAAQPGDWVIATGYHGLSQVGLLALQRGWENFQTSKKAHLTPMPQIKAGTCLAQRFERYALTDSSDGLADALIKMAQSSCQHIVIEERKIPVHPEVSAFAAQAAQAGAPQALARETILYGGEDFQLIAAVPNVDADILAHFHVIGRVLKDEERPDLQQQAPGAWIQLQAEPNYLPLTLQKTYQHFEDSL